jgi:transcriptional regulator with XRE-family HTH domain
VPKKLQVAFGRRIRELRDKAGWTQRTLSGKTGISTQHISNIENGRREPCLGMMGDLAKAFGMNLSQLLQGID